jgi:hypothetical protein
MEIRGTILVRIVFIEARVRLQRPRTRYVAALQMSNVRELDREKDFPKGTYDLKRA